MSTTIRVSRETKNKLEQVGHKNQSFDDIVRLGAMELFNKNNVHIINVPVSTRNGIEYIEIRVPKHLKSFHVDKGALSDAIYGIAEDNNIEILSDEEVPFFNDKF